MADRYEFSVWAEGYATDADGNLLDSEGRPLKPERVLSEKQTRAFERLVRATNQEEPK